MQRFSTGVIIFPRKFLLLGAALAVFCGALTNTRGALASITVDATTGHVLAQENPSKKRQVGSLTKIATAMVVLDWAARQSGDLAQVASIPPAAFVGTSENAVGFQPGDLITLRDLLYAALVQSDNVAAYTLADYVGAHLTIVRPENARATPADFFVQQMNALALHLGMIRTRFLNPSGIDTKEKPFSTAADMARLTRYAMNNAGFRFYVSQKQREISFTRGPAHMRYLLRNTNELLGTNGIDGVKTGRTPRAGDCLILSAARPSEVVVRGTTSFVTPRRLIVVLLGSTDRFGEGAQLLAQGWELYDQWVTAGRPNDASESLTSPNE
ncbi:MAG TPA: serine hydrolase [Chthoniobacterales bacterium]|jgi:D-alanyl-D-alanine carboxypeptidase